ncbi:MAG: response regulator [Candidatus Methylomirabilales bacterium]
MTRVLLLDADPLRQAPVEAALTAAGHEVRTAPSAAFALTMLERERPDVIVSRAELPDMFAYELCAIVRSDPMTSGVPFIVLTDRAPATPDAVTRAVADLPPPPPAGPDHPGPPPRRRPAPPTPADRLPTDRLHEAVHAVSNGRKTGRLVVRFAGAEAALLFQAGRLLHAEFQGQTGETAVSSLVTAAAGSGAGGEFRFMAWDGSEVVRAAPDVDTAAQARLLRACAALQAGHAPAGPPAVTRDA